MRDTQPMGLKYHAFFCCCTLFGSYPMSVVFILFYWTAPQGMPFILLMVIDKYADDFGGILRQKDSCHTGDILPLFQQSHDPFYRFIRDFLCFSMDHIGYCCCT